MILGVILVTACMFAIISLLLWASVTRPRRETPQYFEPTPLPREREVLDAFLATDASGCYEGEEN